jgi:hypothetical protein
MFEAQSEGSSAWQKDHIYSSTCGGQVERAGQSHSEMIRQIGSKRFLVLVRSTGIVIHGEIFSLGCGGSRRAYGSPTFSGI